MNKLNQNITGVEACDLQEGDAIVTTCGKKLLIACVCNMSGKTYVSFHNASEVSFNQSDKLNIVRYIYA